MEHHSCATYFAVCFDIDVDKNAALLRKSLDCTPEEIGIYNKEEVEAAIIELGVIPKWHRHRFVIGYNDNYDVNVNEMIRVTLKELFGKEAAIKELCDKFNVTAMLEIVPHIAKSSNEPTQILSLESDIIDFLHKSGTQMDLDYYIM